MQRQVLAYFSRVFEQEQFPWFQPVASSFINQKALYLRIPLTGICMVSYICKGNISMNGIQPFWQIQASFQEEACHKNAVLLTQSIENNGSLKLTERGEGLKPIATTC